MGRLETDGHTWAMFIVGKDTFRRCCTRNKKRITQQRTIEPSYLSRILRQYVLYIYATSDLPLLLPFDYTERLRLD